MKNLARTIEELLSEIAFAEEREMQAVQKGPGRFTERLDDLFTAITFAEAGELETARDIAGGGHGSNRNGGACNLPRFCTGTA